MVRYLSKRHGDTEHKERIDDNVVTDLKISYCKNNLPYVEALKVSLEFNNIFNEKYVSVINAMDDNRGGNPSYYVGSPFNSMITLSLNF